MDEDFQEFYVYDSNDSNPFALENGSDYNLENGTANGNDTAEGNVFASIKQTVLATIFILTMIGNIIVMLGIYFRKEKMTRMYYFILHLCIADLTTAIFQVLTQLFWEITEKFQGGPFMCKLVKYTQILGPYSSSYIIVMTALDRYQAICYPLSNCTWTARRSKLMLGIAWSLSLLFCIPQLQIFAFQEVPEGSGSYNCWATFVFEWGEKAYITWYCISVFIIPLIILVFAYTCITRAIWLNFNMKNAAAAQEESPDRTTARDLSDDNDTHSCQDLRNNSVGSNKERRATGRPATKNLRVSWRQRKSGNETKTFMSADNSAMDSPLMNTASGEHQSKFHMGHESGQECVAGSLESPTSSFHGPLSSHPSRQSSARRQNSGGSCGSKRENLGKRQPNRTISTLSQDSGCPTESSDNFTRVNEILTEHDRDQSDHLLSPSSAVGRTQRSTRKSSKKSSGQTQNYPRTHSVKVISRAKIKTVKLTVTVIFCYIVCSTPFIASLLWKVYDPNAKEHPFFYGPTFAVLTLLASLNSCANAYIVMVFNPNLVESFKDGMCECFCRCRSPRNSSRNLALGNSRSRSILRTDRRATGLATNTTVTRLSPLMIRPNGQQQSNLRYNKSTDSIELVPQENRDASPVNSLAIGLSKNQPVEPQHTHTPVSMETSFTPN